MKKILFSYVTPVIAAVIGGCVAATAASGAVAGEQEMSVPGFADFIAVDGATVWVTNRGRVERWSRQGKLAAVAMDHPCGAMAIASGSLWVADCQDKTLERIDLESATRSATIATGIGSRGELNVVAGAGSIWVPSDPKGRIARVDPATNKVIATIKVAPDSHYLAFGLGALWAVSADRQLLQKIDPATNKVVKRTKLGKEPGFLTAGEGAVWVQEQGDGTVARIDPATGKVSGRVKVSETLKYGDIDTGGGKVWLRTTTGQTFVEIDPRSLAILARVGKDVGSGGLRYSPDGLWTTAHDQHTLTWWPVPTSGED